MTRRNALTLPDLLVILIVILTLFAMSQVLFSCGAADTSSGDAANGESKGNGDLPPDFIDRPDPDALAARARLTTKDAAQLKQIHQTFLIFANENQDILPTPGRVSRRPISIDGGPKKYLPGMGREVEIKNHTRHLYSMMIAREFFNPDLLIGPSEVNPLVREMQDYNFDAYSPAENTYWDGDFPAPLTGGEDPNVGGFFVAIDGKSHGEVSHTSYAHMALFGARKRLRWRNTQSASDPILSTRGTGGGPGGFGGAEAGSPEYDHSPTLRLHGSDRQWVGNVVFSDNSVHRINTFSPPHVSYQPYRDGDKAPAERDNIFAAEFEDDWDHAPLGSGDAWLGIFTRTTATLTEPIFDPLD